MDWNCNHWLWEIKHLFSKCSKKQLLQAESVSYFSYILTSTFPSAKAMSTKVSGTKNDGIEPYAILGAGFPLHTPNIQLT